MKKTSGFSYIEVIIALALFAIAMLAIIPALYQAGRNMFFAEETYTGHLQAQRIMLVVRGSLADGKSLNEIRADAISSAVEDLKFSVWIFGQNTRSFHTIDTPDANVTISGLNPRVSHNTSTIVAIVWGEDGQVAGRAVGMLHH